MKSLYESNRTIFDQSIKGPDGATLAFWESMRDTPFVANHRTLKREDWDKAIPVGLHGDAGSFSKQESVYLFTFNSLLGAGSTASKRFIFTVMKKSQMTRETINEILKVFAWSCNAMSTGITPEFDWSGRPTEDRGGVWMAGGLKAFLAHVRGGWHFLKDLSIFHCFDGNNRNLS